MIASKSIASKSIASSKKDFDETKRELEHQSFKLQTLKQELQDVYE